MLKRTERQTTFEEGVVPEAVVKKNAQRNHVVEQGGVPRA